MVSVMKMEKDGAIAKLQKIFVNGTLELFELWINYYKYESPEDAPKIDNKEGAEVLLQFYFKRAPDKMYEYLRTTENHFISKHISKREDCITFTSDSELSEAEIENTKQFITSISNKVFTHIQ